MTGAPGTRQGYSDAGGMASGIDGRSSWYERRRSSHRRAVALAVAPGRRGARAGAGRGAIGGGVDRVRVGPDGPRMGEGPSLPAEPSRGARDGQRYRCRSATADTALPMADNRGYVHSSRVRRLAACIDRGRARAGGRPGAGGVRTHSSRRRRVLEGSRGVAPCQTAGPPGGAGRPFPTWTPHFQIAPGVPFLPAAPRVPCANGYPDRPGRAHPGHPRPDLHPDLHPDRHLLRLRRPALAARRPVDGPGALARGSIRVHSDPERPSPGLLGPSQAESAHGRRVRRGVLAADLPGAVVWRCHRGHPTARIAADRMVGPPPHPRSGE